MRANQVSERLARNKSRIYLYLNRELYLTALLFAVYLVIAVFGYLRWRQHFLQQSS